MSIRPLVSVLMPAFNHERFVEQAVRSVWQQTYSNIELIVVDDGSRDGTLALLQALLPHSPIPMKVFSQENRGVNRTLNRCYEQSSGEWIATLASDDAYQPRFVERMIDEALSHPTDSIVLHCDAFAMDEFGQIGERMSCIRRLKPYEGEVLRKVIFGGGYMIPSTAFLSRGLRERVGPYDETLLIEDFEYRIRLASVACFIYVPDALFLARKVNGSLGSKRHLWADDLFKALEKHRDLIGTDYNRLVAEKHGGLSKTFLLSADFKMAYRHLISALTFSAGMKKIEMALWISFGVLRGAPRALVMTVLPTRAIQRIRRIKHQILNKVQSSV